MVDWETQDQFWIHNNARVGLQRITLLGFKFDLRFLRILKLLHIYSFGVLFIYFLYPYFILGQYSFFISEYRSIERDHWPEIYSGTSSFLIQILKKYILFLYTLRMTIKLSWLYQLNLVGSVWLHLSKSMNEFYFLRYPLPSKVSWKFPKLTGKNRWWNFFIINCRPKTRRFIERDSTHVFSSEICEIFKSTTKYLRRLLRYFSNMRLLIQFFGIY